MKCQCHICDCPHELKDFMDDEKYCYACFRGVHEHLTLQEKSKT